jgi:alpha/beta superfamily hydrolase
VILAGYSFGAGIASSIGDERIAGWYLLAPPTEMLSASNIGNDPRSVGQNPPMTPTG